MAINPRSVGTVNGIEFKTFYPVNGRNRDGKKVYINRDTTFYLEADIPEDEACQKLYDLYYAPHDGVFGLPESE